MVVRLFQCSFEGGHSEEYRAIFNTGILMMDGVRFVGNEGGHLVNVVDGTAIITDSSFQGNDVISVVRAIDNAVVSIERTHFERNDARVSLAGLN